MNTGAHPVVMRMHCAFQRTRMMMTTMMMMRKIIQWSARGVPSGARPVRDERCGTREATEVPHQATEVPHPQKFRKDAEPEKPQKCLRLVRSQVCALSLSGALSGARPCALRSARAQQARIIVLPYNYYNYII